MWILFTNVPVRILKDNPRDERETGIFSREYSVNIWELWRRREKGGKKPTLSLSLHSQAKNHTKPHYFRSGGLIRCHVDVSEHFWDTYTLLLIRNRDQRAWGSRPVLSSVFVYIEPERGRAAGPPHNILNNISQVCGPHLMPACSNWKRLGM